MMWGKAPYEQPGSITEDVNVAPLRRFPGAGRRRRQRRRRLQHGPLQRRHRGHRPLRDHPCGERPAVGRGRELGARRQRRAGPALGREPHAPPERGARPTTGTTPVPDGCQWPNGAVRLRLPGPGTTDCFDGLRNFNQARPAAVRRRLRVQHDPVGQLRSGSTRRYNLPFDQPLAQRRRRADPGGQVRGQDHRAAGLQAPEGRRQERRLRRPVRPAAVLADRVSAGRRRRRGPSDPRMLAVGELATQTTITRRAPAGAGTCTPTTVINDRCRE